MNQNAQENKITAVEEISIKDVVSRFKAGIKYLKSKWFLIFIAGLICGAIGLLYSVIKKPTYAAVCTFVLDDAKSSGGLGQYAGLASLAGINIGDGGNTSIFSGDNIIELYKSRTMLEKALLSTCSFDGKNQLLIDRFIDKNNLRSQDKDDDKIGNVNFTSNPDRFSRLQDSIITSLVELFNKKILNVTKPDKKLSIIRVEVETKDELFSKYFTEKLVQTVNDFYVQTKTKKAFQNVQILQHQADSVKKILNSSISSVASANDAAPDANPLMSTLRVSSQKKQVDVQANVAIYSEIAKNMEIAKISLRQEIPLIQVIDKPVLPLFINHVTKVKATSIGIIIGFILAMSYFVLKKLYNIL